jgi:perosamine synthetase
MTSFRVPYSVPNIPISSVDSLIHSLKRVEISGAGGEINKLENIVRESIQVENCLAVSNGSAALRLAFMTLGLRPGSKVLLPGWGFHVAANIATSMGANVEFVDVSLESWCADYTFTDLDEYGPTDFVVLIHTLGNCSNLTFMENIKQDRQYSIIEDSAEALFSMLRGEYLGTLFDIGTFSMHAAKTVTSGEGGFIVTNNRKLYDIAKLVRSHGVVGTNYYIHTLVGDNFRLSNLLAALANPQFELKKEIIARRNEVYSQYMQNLNSLPVECFITPTDKTGFFPWGFGLRIKEGVFNKNAIELRQILAANGIDSRPGFSSASQLPYFRESMIAKNNTLKNSDTLSREVLLLPHYESLTSIEIVEICELIKANLI